MIQEERDWTPKEKEYIEVQFERFYDNKMEFSFTALAIADMMANAEDSGELLGERKFYAQIFAAVMEDDRKSISLEEKVLFINMHVALKNIYERQNPAA